MHTILYRPAPSQLHVSAIATQVSTGSVGPLGRDLPAGRLVKQAPARSNFQITKSYCPWCISPAQKRQAAAYQPGMGATVLLLALTRTLLALPCLLIMFACTLIRRTLRASRTACPHALLTDPQDPRPYQGHVPDACPRAGHGVALPPGNTWSCAMQHYVSRVHNANHCRTATACLQPRM